MKRVLNSILATGCVMVAISMAAVPANSQTIAVQVANIALKSGESTELGDVFWINANCKSMLKATPKVEVLDGPPGVQVAIKEAMVVPRVYSCARPVNGGKLVISASDIDDQSYTQMTLRVTYKTSTGERQRSRVVNVSLFP